MSLPVDCRLLDHPRGLWVLAGTEFWDRVSFHGMQALLVLYMVDTLLLPGHIEKVVGFDGFRAGIEAITGPLSIQALAAQTFGLYVGLVYFAPIIGGAVGDRITGRRVAVISGALLMTAGHFALAFDATFLVALLVLILGVGLLRKSERPGQIALRRRRPARGRCLPALLRRDQRRSIHRADRNGCARRDLWLACRICVCRHRHVGRPCRLSGRPETSATRFSEHGGAAGEAVAGGTATDCRSCAGLASVRHILDRPDPGLEYLQSVGT